MSDDHPITQLETRGTRRGPEAMASTVISTLVKRRRRRVAAGVVAAVTLLGAVGFALAGGDKSGTVTGPAQSVDSSATSTPPQLEFAGEGSAAEAIADAAAAWEAAGISDYVLRITPRCFCNTATYLSKVVDGQAVTTIAEETETLHGALSDGDPWTPTTVDELFGILRTYDTISAGVGRGSTYEFTLDESGRWPVSISVDPITNGNDDEFGFAIELLNEEPAVLAGEIVHVAVSTGHTFGGAPVSLVLESATSAGMPEPLVPPGAITYADLEEMNGLVLREAVTPAQVLVEDLFVAATITGSMDFPDGTIAISLQLPVDAGIDVGDAVVATTPSATVEGTILAISPDRDIVTLLVPDDDAPTLAAAGNRISISVSQ